MILTFIALAVVFGMAKVILIPFVLSIFIWLIYSPVIVYLQNKFKLPRALVLLISLFLFVGGFALITFFIGTSVDSFIKGADQYKEKLDALTYQIPLFTQKFGFEVKSADLQGMLKNLPIMSFIKGLTGSMIGFVSNTFLVIIFSLFLLTGESISNQNPGIISEIKDKTRKYVLTKVILSFFTALCTYIVLMLFDVEMAFMFAIFTFMLNFIPNIGSIIAVILPIPVMLLQFNFGIQIPAILVLLFSIQMVFGNILEPKMLGESMGLHPVTILLFLTFWGYLWGITGMFLSVPITATMKIIFSKFEMTKPISDLFSGNIDSINQA
jgi:AI-2 transport protein TqsA